MTRSLDRQSKSGSVRMCRNGHEMSPENTATNGRCRTCKREADRRYEAKNRGRSTPNVQRYREDPEKRERDRERSRRWKREHLGQPGRPKAAYAK